MRWNAAILRDPLTTSLNDPSAPGTAIFHTGLNASFLCVHLLSIGIARILNLEALSHTHVLYVYVGLSRSTRRAAPFLWCTLYQAVDDVGSTMSNKLHLAKKNYIISEMSLWHHLKEYRFKIWCPYTFSTQTSSSPTAACKSPNKNPWQQNVVNPTTSYHILPITVHDVG